MGIDPTMRATTDPNIRSIDFIADLGDGADTFTLDGSFPPDVCRVAVQGGAGNDTFNTRIGSATALTPTNVAASIDLHLDGGEGDDVFVNTLRLVNLNGRVNLDINGGAGNDRIINVFDHVTVNGGMTLNVNGGQGDDDLQLLATAPSSREAAGYDPALVIRSRVQVNLTGGSGNDHFVGDITPCIEPQGEFDLVFVGGRGADVFDIQLALEPKTSATTEQAGPMRLAVLGGSGDDQLRLAVANYGKSTSPLDIDLVGGPGRDTAEVSPGIDLGQWGRGRTTGISQ
jgi:hypothetical protein